MLQNKLKHKVVFCSSEDPGFSSKELNNASADSKGWLSSRFPEYPQEIGFELLSGNSFERNLHLTQVQILSHQSKIATKIEIFIGIGNDYQNATFKRLGFLSLDGNERSSYQARELKTVYVDQSGNYLKFRVQKNYVNDQNPFNQVGIMAVNFFGDESSSSAPAPFLSNNIYNNNNNNMSNSVLGIDVKLDSSTLAKLKILYDAKAKAIENEDYITAKAIKLAESEIKELTTTLAKLDSEKKEAVAAEDYDLATQLKEQGDVLRKSIAQKIMSIHIPGVVVSAPVPLNASHRPLTSGGVGATATGDDNNSNSNYNSPDHNNNNNHSAGGRKNNNNNDNTHDEKPVAAAMKRLDIDDIPISGTGGGRNRRGSHPENNNNEDEDGNNNGEEDDDDYEHDFEGVDSRPQSGAANNRNNNNSRPNSRAGINSNRKLSNVGNMGEQDISMIDKTHHEDDIVAVQNNTAPKGGRYNIHIPNAGDGGGMNFNTEGGDGNGNGADDEYYSSSGGAGGRGGGKASQYQFPPGEHPLQDAVSGDSVNVNDWPDPDAFSIKAKSYCEQTGILRLLDDYVARCLFSKSWVLRDAAINKTHLIVLSQLETNQPDDDNNNSNSNNSKQQQDPVTILTSMLPAIVAVCKVGIEDKNSQVNFNAFDFLEQIISLLNQYKINRSIALPAFESVSLLNLLIEKLAENNQRARDGAKKSLIQLAKSNSITCNPIANTTLKPLSAKQKLAWRPLQSRLALLVDLITQHGLSNNNNNNTSGMSVESIMNYIKINNAFAHSSVEVRDATKELTVAIQKLVGTAAIENYLADLRPKQREEYANAFGEVGNSNNANLGSGKQGNSPSPRIGVSSAAGGGTSGSGSGNSGITPTKKGAVGNSSARATSGGTNNNKNNNNQQQPQQRGASPKANNRNNSSRGNNCATSSGGNSGSGGTHVNDDNDKLSNLRHSQNLNNSSAGGGGSPLRGGGTPNKHSNNNHKQNNNNRSSSSPLRKSQNNVNNATSNNRYQNSSGGNDEDDEDFATADEKRSNSGANNNVDGNNQSLRASQKYFDNKQYDDNNTTNNDNINNVDVFVCQFCGDGNTQAWTEDTLDSHYLSTCPYLAPCPACQQILEIASLPDHLLDECKYKSQYVPCDVTGLAIKIIEMNAWQKSTACVSPPDNCFYCPMCLAAVEDDTEPWRVHLLKQCPQKRRRGGSVITAAAVGVVV